MIKSILSITFFLSALISFYLGIYSLKLNKNEGLNRILFAICMSTAIWAFGFAVGTPTNDYQEALLWRRISALGWGPIFGFILHFTLLLTSDHRYLKKRWHLILMYIPPLWTVVVYGVFNPFSKIRYNIINSPFGWLNLVGSHWIESLFKVYYLSYSALIIMLLIKCYRGNNEERYTRANALALLISYISALVLASLTDVFGVAILGLKLPALAPVFMLLPILTIYHIIHKNKSFHMDDQVEVETEYLILSLDKKVKLYNFITMVLLVGGCVGLLKSFVIKDDLTMKFIYTLILILCSGFISLVPFIFKSNRRQEYVLTTLLIIIMLTVDTIGATSSFSDTAWIAPLLIIMVTVVFNNKVMFNSVALMSLFIGGLNLLVQKEEVAFMDYKDHLYRLLVLGIAIALTSYISNIYRLRLQATKKQTEFQQMVFDLSASFISVDAKNLGLKVNGLLEQCGEFLNANRAYVGKFTEGYQSMTLSHEWHKTQEDGTPVGENKVLTMPYTWVVDKISLGESIYIEDIDQLPIEAEVIRKSLAKRKVQSLLVLPIISQKAVVGFLAFDLAESNKKWSTDDIDLWGIITQILAEAFAKLKAERDMQQLAYYDLLTGLPNRRCFYEKLTSTLEKTKDRKDMVGVVFIDLDGFKEVNDSLGHDWGDRLLQEVGSRLQDSVDKETFISRFGGDEFILLIPKLQDKETLEKLVLKFVDTLSEPIELNQYQLYITASVGIAFCPSGGCDAKTLIKNADMAMYEAKYNGKNQHAWYTRDMKERAHIQKNLTNAMHHAIDNDQFQLLLKPIMKLKSQKVIGIDLSMVWQHPDVGLVMPERFMSIAFQAQLVDKLNYWYIDAALNALNKSLKKGLFYKKVAIELSIEQVNAGLIPLIQDRLDFYALKASNIELKIAESDMRKGDDSKVGLLGQLEALGLTLSLYNFGSDYTSLSKLKALPINRLKIDQQFIQGITVNTQDDIIVKVIIDLAKALGLKVDAQGVTTKAQMDFLLKEGCDEAECSHSQEIKPLMALEVELCSR